MRFIALMCVTSLCLGQGYIDSILDRNPFDPNRGQVEPDVPEVVIPPAEDIPLLDGTIIIGTHKYALFTFNEGGQKESTSVTINDMVAGYKLVTIDRSFVELDAGKGPFKVEMFTGEKKNRGGTKASTRAMSKKSVAKKTDKRRDDKAKKSKNARKNAKDDKKRKTRFIKRETPKQNTNAKNKKTSKENKF